MKNRIYLVPIILGVIILLLLVILLIPAKEKNLNAENCQWKPSASFLEIPCNETYTAYYYDGKICRTISTCVDPAIIPFVSLEACQKKCEDPSSLDLDKDIPQKDDESDVGEDSYINNEETQKISQYSLSECAQKGGVWKIWGLSPEASCNIATQDAGKPCTDMSQCETVCIADPQSTGEEVLGQCYGWNRIIGSCFTFIENGKMGKALCID